MTGAHFAMVAAGLAAAAACGLLLWAFVGTASDLAGHDAPPPPAICDSTVYSAPGETLASKRPRCAAAALMLSPYGASKGSATVIAFKPAVEKLRRAAQKPESRLAALNRGVPAAILKLPHACGRQTPDWYFDKKRKAWRYLCR